MKSYGISTGAILAEGTLAEVQANEDVIEKYLGRLGDRHVRSERS